MQGTADGIADDQSVGERAAIVRATGADGEELVARARQQHVLVSDTPDQHAAGLELPAVDTLGEIRSCPFV